MAFFGFVQTNKELVDRCHVDKAVLSMLGLNYCCVDSNVLGDFQ